MARENAPKMLQHYKDQKHIEILQKKKDEAISKQQRIIDEIIKIKGDIDTHGGQWVLEKDMERALENLIEGNKFTLNQLLLNWRKLANLTISLEHTASVADSACRTILETPEELEEYNIDLVKGFKEPKIMEIDPFEVDEIHILALISPTPIDLGDVGKIEITRRPSNRWDNRAVIEGVDFAEPYLRKTEPIRTDRYCRFTFNIQ
ncbi:unnamed protein product [Mytilus edulis]|uniref:Uncharacterized protein n=1 Tax=Mytilus edulis TaxID=6550 RepID=A0A8S3SFD6_MYTED|nr:unnamed protein product [Mytilus edulis]